MYMLSVNYSIYNAESHANKVKFMLQSIENLYSRLVKLFTHMYNETTYNKLECIHNYCQNYAKVKLFVKNKPCKNVMTHTQCFINVRTLLPSGQTPTLTQYACKNQLLPCRHRVYTPERSIHTQMSTRIRKVFVSSERISF